MKWIVTANTNDCHIYEYDVDVLKTIKHMSHPESKLQSKEYLTDRPGHYKTQGGNRGAYDPHTEPEEVELEEFVREIATELNEARNRHCYDDLVFIMPAKVEGLLSKTLNKHVNEMVKLRIHKNTMNLSEKELLEFFKKNRLH